MTRDEERQIADRDRVVYAASFSADRVAIDNYPDFYVLPGHDQTHLILQAALGYLIGRGLIAVKPQDEWPEWLNMEIPDHLRPDVPGEIARWRARAEKMSA